MDTRRQTLADEPVVVTEPLPPPATAERVAQPVGAYETSLPYDSERTTTRTRVVFSLAQLVHAICGIALTAFGVVTMARGGFDAPLGEQTTSVLGLTQTTAIGIAEAGAGVLLIVAALSPRLRAFGGFIGALVAVGGIMLLAGSDDLIADLHTERSLGWVLVAIGGVSLLAAFLPTHTVDSTHSEVRGERVVDRA